MENLKNILIKDVKIIDSQSQYNGTKKDILIKDGFIKEIGANIKLTDPFFETNLPNLHVSPGWLDLHTRIGEPGLEHRETIETGLNSAAKGGFTAVVSMPNTKPPIENKTDIIFLIKKSMHHIVDVFPTGCITKGCQQREITEMFEMHKHGAVAFTDDKKTIQNAMLMNIALEYVKNFNGLIMSSCLDQNINKFGQINEGIISTKTGLSPSPELAETLIILRDLEILKYTQSKLHISNISTTESIKLIKKAKKEKLNISTNVAAHQIILSEDNFNNFDTNLKVIPPLRDEKTRQALIKAIIDGTIDAISSDHTPIEYERKKCEFSLAKFGIIGLETVFPIINTMLNKKIELSKIIDLISLNPRKILGLPIVKIEVGEYANMTLFNPTKKWTYSNQEIASMSKNTPFTNYEFIGKPIGIVNKSKIQIDD